MSDAVLIMILSGEGLTAIVGAIVTILNYRNNKKSQFAKGIEDVKIKLDVMEAENKILKEELLALKQDTTRTQLQIAMKLSPQNKDTIELIAKRYFTELYGNWYMDSEFQSWAKENNVILPSWYKGNKE